MKYLPLVIFILLKIELTGQNLIPNPGFDIITDCPTGPSQISLAPPWFAGHNTPDLFNACSADDFCDVPHGGYHYLSYQPPRSGSGFAGIVSYADGFNEYVGEYIETPLLQKLKTSKQYYIEFYVSPDVDPDPDSYWCYTDGIGLAFNNEIYFEDILPHKAMSLPPAVENVGTLIEDSIGWTRISGCYLANGNEQYAILGNFKSEKETHVIKESLNVAPYLNHFFIEDVLVMEFDPLVDTIILCTGETKTLNAGFLDAKYLWNNGETDSVLIVSAPGKYIVQAIMENCVLEDSVIIIDGDNPAYFPTDTLICPGEDLKLNAPLPGVYHWSTGSTQSSISIPLSGDYELTVENVCGQFIFSSSVIIEDCDCQIFVPNVFSPNDDGINDRIQAFIACDFDYTVSGFQIFDRWGNMVYAENAGENIDWDGTFSGQKLETGIYVWDLQYEVIRDGISIQHRKTGDVTLIR